MLEADDAETGKEVVSFYASVWKVAEAAAIAFNPLQIFERMRSPARSATKR
jgi:hypothetical protein